MIAEIEKGRLKMQESETMLCIFFKLYKGPDNRKLYN